MQKSEAKCIYFSDWNSFSSRVASVFWVLDLGGQYSFWAVKTEQEIGISQDTRGEGYDCGQGEWREPEHASITHTQRTHCRRVRPREQKGEPERKLKAELTLGGKWKAGAEIRYRRSRKQKLQETNRNLQWIHSIRLGVGGGRAWSALLKLSWNSGPDSDPRIRRFLSFSSNSANLVAKAASLLSTWRWNLAQLRTESCREPSPTQGVSH